MDSRKSDVTMVTEFSKQLATIRSDLEQIRSEHTEVQALGQMYEVVVDAAQPDLYFFFFWGMLTI
jgi:hypothetical protein